MAFEFTPWVSWHIGQKESIKPQASSSGVGASSDASGGPKLRDFLKYCFKKVLKVFVATATYQRL